MRFLILAAVCLAGALLSGAALAQEDEEAADSVRYSLDPVTITGTRGSHSWIQAPVSISIVGTKELRRTKGYGLDEVLSFVPGVLAQSRFGNQDVRLVIRGFGARGAGERSNSGTTRGIRILNNGFPETEPDGRTSFDLVDITAAGAVEVMRSNASSLYGNAGGGIVNIMSNTSFESPYAVYRQSFGSFGFHKEHLAGGTNLGTGKVYYSLGNTTADGWRGHSRSSQALFDAGVVADLGGRTDLGVHLTATSNVFRIPGALTQEQFDADPSMSDSLYVARDERRNNRLGRLGVTVGHALDDRNTVSAMAFVQPKFLQRSERGTFRDFTRYHVGGNVVYRNVSEPGAGLRNEVSAGIDEAYQDGAILFYTLSPEGGRALPLRDNKREGANNLGGFLQDELSIGDSWIVLAGLRYDDVTYYSENYVDLVRDSKSFRRVTPKAALTHRFSPTHSVYASLGGGLEVPAGNETDPAGTYGQDTVYGINPLLDAMKSTTLEVGTKQIVGLGGETPAAWLTYDVAAYWLRITDDIVPYRNGRFYFSVGRTERMGLEAGGELNFTMGLTASAAFTISNNEYKEYTVDSAHYGNPGAVADFSGNKVVGVPDVFYSLGLRYSPRGFRPLFTGVSMQSVGEYFADDANAIAVPSYTVFNANVGIDRWTPGGGRIFVSALLGVNNIGDAKYVGSAWLNPDIVDGAPVYIEPGLPRNFVGSVSVGMNL
jgi:iron complex outermembrane receptor protein